MNKCFKKMVMTMLCVCSAMGTLFQPIKAEAKETEWMYGYTGKEQEFIAPYSGLFQFELTGAQGQNAVYEGGKGGRVTATVKLAKGERVVILVGGQNGYNGGGAGNISNGGGATDIRLNGNQLENRVLVAGGGGGANIEYAGGAGGTDAPGTTEEGSGRSTEKGAGGGGGYYGGSAGEQLISEHVHNGTAESGGECYLPVYHEHSGTGTEGGGCYTVPVYHNHKDSCYEEGYWCEWGKPYLAGGTPSAWISKCSCGKESVSSHESGCETGKHEYHRGALICDKSETETIESYELGCGKTNKTVIRYDLNCDKKYDAYEVTQSRGGSNWYQPLVCTNGTSETGVQEGNGACIVKALSVYNLYYENIVCRSIYYGETKVKRVFFDGTLVYKE